MSRTKKETTIFWVFNCPERPRIHSIIFCLAAVIWLDVFLYTTIDFTKLKDQTKTESGKVSDLPEDDAPLPIVVLLLVGFYMRRKDVYRKDMDLIRKSNKERGIELSNEEMEAFMFEFSYVTKSGIFNNKILFIR